MMEATKIFPCTSHGCSIRLECWEFCGQVHNLGCLSFISPSIDTWICMSLNARSWKSNYLAELEPWIFRGSSADLIADTHTCMHEAKHRPGWKRTIMQHSHISSRSTQLGATALRRNVWLIITALHYMSPRLTGPGSICVPNIHRDNYRICWATWEVHWWENHAPTAGFYLERLSSSIQHQHSVV